MTSAVRSPAELVLALPLAEARRRLLAAVGARAPVTVPLEEAIGRVAACDVPTEQAWPATDIALIDGWAVASRDTIGAAPVAPVYVDAVRPIAAGDRVSAGCDAVLAPHQGREEMGFLVAEATVAPGENVLRRGCDLPLGAPIVTAGKTVDAFAIAVAKRAGLGELAIRRPRVAVCADASAGTVGDFLTEACRRLGAEVVSGDADTAAELILQIEARMVEGDRPSMCPALVGAESVRLTLGEGQGTLRLPDRLDVAALVFEALVAPALDHASGRVPPTGGEVRALARKIASRVGLSELVLLGVTPDGLWLPLAVGQLSSAAWANAAAVVELGPESEGMPEGTPLRARPPRFRS